MIIPPRTTTDMSLKLTNHQSNELARVLKNHEGYDHLHIGQTKILGVLFLYIHPGQNIYGWSHKHGTWRRVSPVI